MLGLLEALGTIGQGLSKGLGQYYGTQAQQILQRKALEDRLQTSLEAQKQLAEFNRQLEEQKLQKRLGLLKSLFGDQTPKEYPYMAATLLGAKPIIPKQTELPKEVQLFKFAQQQPGFMGFLKKLQAQKGTQRIPADIQVFHEYSTNPDFRNWWDRKQNKSLAALAFKMAADAELNRSLPEGMTKEEYAEYIYNRMVSMGKTKPIKQQTKKKATKKKPSVFDILDMRFDIKR